MSDAAEAQKADYEAQLADKNTQIASLAGRTSTTWSAGRRTSPSCEPRMRA